MPFAIDLNPDPVRESLWMNLQNNYSYLYMNDLSTSKSFLLLLGIAIQCNLLYAQGEGVWQKIKEKDNIEIFTRSTPFSSIKEVRIKTTFQVGLDQFVDAINKVSAYPQWVYKCTTARRVRTLNENEFVYYVVSDLPFPLKDRDVFIHSRQWFEEETQTYRAESVATSDRAPSNDKLVRIPKLHSRWTIKVLTADTIAIDYSLLTEPGGSLPSWLVNMAVTTGPIRTMKGLEQFLLDDLRTH